MFQFNRKPADGVKFLVTENLLPEEPKAISEFLRHTPGLDKVFSRSLFKSASHSVVCLSACDGADLLQKFLMSF